MNSPTRTTALLLIAALVLPAVLASTHTGYSAPRTGFSASTSVSVDDTAVYKTGYVSENGSQWQAFTLTGDQQKGNWILSRATADIDLSNTRYVAIFSCTWSNGWDCSETWQVKDRGVQNTIDSKAGDEAALQALYTSTNGRDWDDNTGWSSSDMDLNDEIFGVTVEDIDGEPRVTQVNLNNNGLRGNIEVPELGNLKQMRLFAVSINDLYSTIPEELGSATNLEYLYLSRSDVDGDKTDLFPHEDAESGSGDVHPGKRKSNEANVFHGPVPASLGNLHKLKWITLSWTDSEEEATDGISSLPEELFDIRTFEGIQIYNNNNVADLPFPQGITQMSNLTYLAIGVENSGRDTGPLTGDLPANFGDLSNLKHLRLGENPELRTDFGEVDFSGMASIKTFGLGNTDVRGSIPDAFFDGSMPELIVFGVSWPRNPTGISGPFPEVDAVMDTHVYQFNRNSLTSLPASAWTSNTKIIQPNFRDNSLTTIGTADLTQQDRLRYLRLGGNELHEPWPYLDWDTIAAQGGLDGVDFDRNRYVFKHMLYVPPNGDKPIIEHYEDMIDADPGNAGLDYSPQKPFGQAATRSVNTGGSITLDDFSSVVEHPDNQYQWQLDGSSITGANSRELTISEAQQSDAGEYTLRVTNPGAPDLTLTSEPVTLSVTDASTDSKAGDEEALEALYASAGGSGWADQNGWGADMDLSQPIDRVTVETINGEPRVTQIDLRANGLTGSIDVPELGNLKEMRLFAVTFNDLDTQIPPEIGQATNLEYLYLSMSDATVYTEEWPHERATWGSGDIHPGKRKGAEGNIYRGAIPPEIGNLQKLKWFVLDWTDSEEGAEDGISSAPQELFDISTMQGLHLFNNNNIADLQLPASVCEMTNLDQIAIGVEKSGRDTGPLVGQMPTCFGQLENVRHVRFGENPDFTTDFDAVDFSNMRSIMTFSVSATRVTGSLPKYFVDGTMPELIMFGSSWPRGDTGLEGAFPEVNPVMDMHIYQFRNNKLTSLPASAWTGNTKIIQPEFADNRLTTLGTTDMTMQDRFRYFRASGNELHEPWPYLDWDTIAAQGGLDGAEFDDNRYVFKHMLYVPPNGDKPIIEHYEDMIDADSGNAGLDYRSQKPFGQAASYTISAGDSITIDDFADIVEHPDNEYWWEHDGNTISGENSDTLTINNADSSDSGEYVLYAENDGAPGLTIQSQPVELLVS